MLPIVESRIKLGDIVDEGALGGRELRPLWVVTPILGALVLLAFAGVVTIEMLAGARGFFGARSLWVLPGALGTLALGLARVVYRRFAEIIDALRRSEERLKLAVAGTNDGLWDWNILEDTISCSPRVGEMLGYGIEPLDAQPSLLSERMHPDDRERWRDAMRAHLLSDEPFEVEVRLRERAGAYRWFLARGGSVRNAERRAARVAGSLKDITNRKRIEAAVARQVKQQGLLAEFGQLALENTNIDDLLARAVVVASQGLECPMFRLLASGPDDQTLVLKGALGWSAEWSQQTAFDAAEETENRFVVGARVSVIIDDFPRERRFKASPMLLAHDVRSGIETLVCGAHGSYAVLGAYAQDVSAFSQEGASFLQGISIMLASAIDRKVAEERLTHMAQFDSLTGLPNRSMFLDRLSQAVAQAGRTGSAVAVLFIDLDRFKLVNDTMGHGAGDELLLLIAPRLQGCLRAGDLVGRLGGDEFAVALTDLARIDDAGQAATRIVESLSKPFEIQGQLAYVSASVGVSVYPDDGSEPDALLRNADRAMYGAKESGRNTHRFFLAEMNERALRRLDLETHLRRALACEEFFLLYQPKASIDSGEISGLEALIRWRHPERGVVSPSEFIPILEETGMITEVGAWVLRAVCQQVIAWQGQGLTVPPVAVNLSARQFNQRNLHDEIGDLLAATGMRPQLLELELTESTLMSDPEGAVRIMEQIKARGIRLSVDDFGTGYSSLAYLKRFPLDSLKIDRTFVRDLAVDDNDRTIAVSIINLAHNLGLKVVAEGVETEAQLEILRGSRCDEMQGYYFAHPLETEVCGQWLEQSPRLASRRLRRVV